MSGNLKRDLLERCEKMEIPLVGVASVDSWNNPPFKPWMPEEYYPQSIYPEARSVIVIGLPVTLPVLETSPSIYYRELYSTVNSLLDQYTYRLASFLTGLGHPSMFIPRDGYGGIKVLLENPVAAFSHRHAALLAGLGNFGVSNMVLTPEHGPRVRFGSVITTADLPPDPMIVEQLCTRCMKCVTMCPAKAIGKDSYPDGLTDKNACASQSAKLNERYISPCGICIKVCPVGDDRKLYHREDISIYSDEERFKEHHKAWNHVRAHGGKRQDTHG